MTGGDSDCYLNPRIFLGNFFITGLISNIGVGSWQRYTLYKCSCLYKESQIDLIYYCIILFSSMAAKNTPVYRFKNNSHHKIL